MAHEPVHNQNSAAAPSGAANASQLTAQLRRYDRTPFLDVLAQMLEHRPTPEALQRFADRDPGRWAAAVTSLARVAGFSERSEVAVDVTTDLSRLSDSQLEARLREGFARLRIEAIEAERAALVDNGSQADP